MVPRGIADATALAAFELGGTAPVSADPWPVVVELPAANSIVQPAPAATPGAASGAMLGPVLSSVDRGVGGEAPAGKKTVLVVVVYVILSMFQSNGLVDNATWLPAGTSAPGVSATVFSPSSSAPVAPAPVVELR